MTAPTTRTGFEKVVCLLPFGYAYITRLRDSSIAFHAFFEWIPAVVLALTVSAVPVPWSVLRALACYFAFVSLYEIGYLVNDRVSSRWDATGRQRGPKNVGWRWIIIFLVTRVGLFLLITLLLGLLQSLGWWRFYVGLVITFALHNSLRDPEVKAISFLWLSWFRFMAPVIVVIDPRQVVGVSFAAAMSYCTFRFLSYLDSKALLRMERRRGTEFRLAIFVIPLVGAVALWPYPATRGFLILCGYFVVASVLGAAVCAVAPRLRDSGQG